MTDFDNQTEHFNQLGKKNNLLLMCLPKDEQVF